MAGLRLVAQPALAVAVAGGLWWARLPRRLGSLRASGLSSAVWRACLWRSLVASGGGRAGGCRGPSRPCGSLVASNAGRAVGCRGPSRPCRSPIGLKRRPGCRVRGSSGTGVGRGRAGVPPHKLQGAGSVASRRPCVQFAAGAPRHDPTPRSRTRPTAGGWMRPSPIQGLSTVTTVNAFARQKDRWATALSFPSHRRDDADETEGAGTCRGAPAANCTLGRLAPIDPAPCSL
ncbi:hypothetical protein SFR_4065 [Streptomyces sp. FR-008]|nr:hypothetical protein SFR_4065 [Streptomyces sp. FR-008]